MGSTPQSTIVRRIRAAYKLRDLMYGREQRPLGRKARMDWALFIAHWCGKGRMRYLHLFEEVARPLKHELGEVGAEGEFDPVLDKNLLELLSVRCRAWVEANPGNQVEFQEGEALGRRKAWARDAIHQGKCPMCGSAEPGACGHGFDRLEFDGRGGYVQYGETHE